MRPNSMGANFLGIMQMLLRGVDGGGGAELIAR
jgi:hypothetical protein